MGLAASTAPRHHREAPLSLRLDGPFSVSRPGSHAWSHVRLDGLGSARRNMSKGRAMNPRDPITPDDEQLDAQASAFAQLVGLTPNDLDGAYRRAIALGDELFPHQIEGVAFLLGRRRAILADDMGLGKTRQAIVALRHTSPGGPYLVVCPASGHAPGVHASLRTPGVARRGSTPSRSTVASPRRNPRRPPRRSARCPGAEAGRAPSPRDP